MAGSFIQTPLARKLQNYAHLPDRSRQELISFLSDSSSGRYTRQSGQITDISKLATTIDLVTSKSAVLDEEVKELHTELAALAKLQAEMDLFR